jgi:hypothetical protein
MQGEYKGDFTRDSFHPAKHFSRVLMQQGRVQLDADWNEQTAILLHYLRSLAADLIGPHGGPAVEGSNGFSVSTQNNLGDELVIGQGHYYVDGILCEFNTPAVPITPADGQNEITLGNTGSLGAQFKAGQYVEIFDGDTKFPNAYFKIKQVQGNVLTLETEPPKFKTAKLRHAVTYTTQPDYPLHGASEIPTPWLVYLDVWERHITYLQDGSCREVALGGADTATRAKVVWQVKISSKIPNLQNNKVDDLDWRKYVSENLDLDNRGLLKARVQPQATSTDACMISPASSYRGAENQLYRVEINNGGSPTATFKWSRDNGSVVFPILEVGTASGQTTVTLGNLGRDESMSLNEGDWVEIVDDTSVLLNQAGSLLKVVTIDRANIRVTLNGAVSGMVGSQLASHPLLRRWEQKDGDPSSGGVQLAADGAIPIVELNWIPLEKGIQIHFQSGGNYRTGDYWLIPARTATGQLEWPMIHSAESAGDHLPDWLPPHGVQHHYAPLAQVNALEPPNIADLRRTFTTQAK